MIDQKIIKIASNTKYASLKNIYTHKSSIKNSKCGDQIKIEIIVKQKKINILRYETQSCILCEASASFLANKIDLFPIKNLKKNIKIIEKAVVNKNSNLPIKLKSLKNLINNDNSSRKDCIMLPFNALLKA